MTLEKEIKEVSNFEKKGNEEKYFDVLAILVSVSAFSYLAYKLFKGFSEYITPYLDTGSYLPFQ